MYSLSAGLPSLFFLFSQGSSFVRDLQGGASGFSVVMRILSSPLELFPDCFPIDLAVAARTAGAWSSWLTAMSESSFKGKAYTSQRMGSYGGIKVVCLVILVMVCCWRCRMKLGVLFLMKMLVSAVWTVVSRRDQMRWHCIKLGSFLGMVVKIILKVNQKQLGWLMMDRMGFFSRGWTIVLIMNELCSNDAFYIEENRKRSISTKNHRKEKTHQGSIFMENPEYHL